MLLTQTSRIDENLYLLKTSITLYEKSLVSTAYLPVYRTISGTVAGKTELGWLENAAHVFGVHRVPSAVDHFHPAAVAQLQQGANHQVHVVPDVARVPDASAADGGHHAVLQGGPAKSVPLLVRVVASGEYLCYV